MYRFVRVFERIANVLPAVTFVEAAAGRPQMQFVIPGLCGIGDNMLLQFSRQSVTTRRFINVQRSQPRTKILSGD